MCVGLRLQLAILLHRVGIGGAAAPGGVHLGEVFGVAAGRHQLAEAVAVGAGRAACSSNQP